MKVIIIDDEKLAIEVLEYYLSELNDIEIVGCYTDPRKFFQEQATIDYDVAFIDVEMPGLSGIDLARNLNVSRPNVVVVFVTAYKEYAFDAYQVDGFDYLMKPVSKERLRKTISKIRASLQKENSKELMQINFKLLGNFMILNGNQPVTMKWRTRRVKELLLYLIHHYPESVDRTQIIQEIWPEKDDKKALGELHATVYRLRLLCSDICGEDVIQVVSGQYYLQADITTDVDRLEAILSFEQASDTAVKNLLHHYQGEYLDVEGYEWANKRRMDLQRRTLLFLENYLTLAMEREQEQQNLVLVESVLQKMLEIDPYNEDYLELLLEYYRINGDEKMLREVYEEFKERLREELAIDIRPETQEIYEMFIK
jgi:two-component SAPR family response regulator